MNIDIPKRIKKYSIISIIFVLLIIYLLSWQPRKCNDSFEGVLYRLNNNGIIKETKVSFEGGLIKPIFGRIRFRGFITIDDTKYNICEIKFDRYNSAQLLYFTDSGSSSSLGTIYLDKTYERFTIQLYEKEDYNVYGWSAKDGLMISAPASNRDVALEITNEVMYKFFNEKFTEFK